MGSVVDHGGGHPHHGRPYSLATRLYDHAYDALLAGARRLTVATQSGSLPFYVGVVLTTVAAAMATALIAGASQSITDVKWFNSALEAPSWR
ncbi:MAG: hypothetical protein R2789_17445 [Microthrixaceae bacterium]